MKTLEPRPTRADVAAVLEPLVRAILGDPPLPITFWDGSRIGPDDGPGALYVRSPEAVRRIMWAPDELGVARAYVAGELEVHGDVLEVLRALRPAAPSVRAGFSTAPAALAAARRIGALKAPPPAPPEEARLRGRRHSKNRDAQSVTHHYDVGNDFYRLILGEAMTYSCARFAHDGMSLVEAQASKHDLICRKLGLHEGSGMRLLDVGCGWGSMAIHAATRYDASVTGITISAQQADLARHRVAEAGVADRVEIRLQDYRDLGGERFDAVSSIGMFEHVGAERMGEYFAVLRSLIQPGGRLLNHAISSIGGSRVGGRTFVHRYVFPDGELLDVGQVVLAMEAAGFEARDVESLREHYALTLRAWVANLEQNWDEAVALVGPGRARVWRLYMAGSAVGFEDGGLGIHQVLGVVPDADGRSRMPRTRDDWST
ncbi:MAG: cyclopropane-fatty-acyl-phospholipid synthase family protein [Acidimicrobiales bacterium]